MINQIEFVIFIGILHNTHSMNLYPCFELMELKRQINHCFNMIHDIDETSN